MTTIRDGFRIYTYKEWKSLSSVQEMETRLENCPTCSGDGRHDCDCGNEHDCQSCDGTGKADSLRDIYEQSLRDELRHAIAWQEGTPLSEALPPMKGAIVTGVPSEPWYAFSTSPAIRLHIH